MRRGATKSASSQHRFSSFGSLAIFVAQLGDELFVAGRSPHYICPPRTKVRAAQMRALALTMKDPEVIILMTDLAADYEKLADRGGREDG